jgi:hypothetical protein
VRSGRPAGATQSHPRRPMAEGNCSYKGIAMKMTKQMRKDFKFLKDVQKMLESYWGKKGLEIFSGIQQDVDAELAPLYGQSLEQVTSHVLAYFRKHDWPEEKITRWLEGKSSPFRTGLHPKDEAWANTLVAEFTQIRLGDVLLALGLPKDVAITLIRARFIAARNRDAI